MKNRLARWGFSLRYLALPGILLLFAPAGTAVPVCVDGNTLSQYITAGTCAVISGPVDLLFTFASDALLYSTDGTGTLTAADIQVNTASNPAGKVAGLTFSSTKFNVPVDALYAYLNLTYTVSMDPAGLPLYRIGSAHLRANLTGTGDDLIFLLGSEVTSGAFNLQIIFPDTGTNITDANYPYNFSALLPTIRPNVDLILTGADADVTSFTGTFGLLPIPEPGSLTLIGGGVILAGLFRRRRPGYR